MIKLVDILKEIAEKPKAIFLAGPAGSGKSFTIKQLIQPDQFKVINVDDTYEELLKTAGLGMSQKDFDADQLSQAAKLMGQAQKATKEKYAELSSQRKNIIIDGTGAAIKPLLKKKEELEALGYETFMIMIWVSPITSLERNVARGADNGRSLLPQIVLRTWRDVNKNIDEYRRIFGDKFVLINNNPEVAETEYNAEDIKKRFFDTSKAKGKEKTPEEMAKAKADKEQLNADIEQLVKNIPEFDSIDQAKSKINTFIK
jgi:dephospho-CoA kinase